MKVSLVLQEWRDSNLRPLQREDVSDGLFSEGQNFEGTLFLEHEDEVALSEAMEQGYYLVMLVNRT